MRSLLTCLLSGLACLFLTACQSSTVNVDYNTQTDFSTVQDYAWFEETSGAEEGFDPLMAQRVRDALVSGLKTIPLQPAKNRDSADVLVRYYIGSHTRSQESKSRGGIGIGSAGGSTAVGLSLSFPLGKDKVVKRAQIIVDFLDPETRKLQWRGTNLIGITDESPEAITTMVNEAVMAILERYPPES